MKLKILHIDDEEDICKLAKEGFPDDKYEFTYETFPAKGLKLALEQKFDAIILDIMMPYMDGYMFLKEYRSQKGRAPVIILSAKNQLVDKFRAINCGADDYIVKPFRPKDLLIRVKQNIKVK